MNRLNGFDLVYAVTQHTVNKQIQLLSIESILPTKWTYQNPKKKFGIDADLDTPVVDMNTGDASSSKVLVSFPLTSGKITYLMIGFDADGNPTVVPKSADVTGWQLTLTVNLSLAKLPPS